MTTGKNIAQEITEELKENAPTLSSIKRKNIFSVPHGYFEELPAKIKEQCIEEDHYKVNRILRLIKPRSIAAAASVILIAISLLVYNPENSNEQLALQNFTNEEIREYLFTGAIYEMNEEDLIIELLKTDNVGGFEDNINDEEIIEYLLDDDIDLIIIMNEIN